MELTDLLWKVSDYLPVGLKLYINKHSNTSPIFYCDEIAKYVNHTDNLVMSLSLILDEDKQHLKPLLLISEHKLNEDNVEKYYIEPKSSHRATRNSKRHKNMSRPISYFSKEKKFSIRFKNSSHIRGFISDNQYYISKGIDLDHIAREINNKFPMDDEFPEEVFDMVNNYWTVIKKMGEPLYSGKITKKHQPSYRKVHISH